MKLAIGRFGLERGVFEVESRGSTPFDARGRNLNVALAYEARRRALSRLARRPASRTRWAAARPCRWT